MIPRITTVLPTYNRSFLLKRAIDSVRFQTYENIKIDVRDNCSKDDTKDVVMAIAEKDDRVSYVRNNENIGISQNIRLGIKNVGTEYFSFLCDDDYLEPEFYSEALKIFDQYPNAGFIAFRVDTVDLEGEVLHSNMKISDGPIKTIYYNSENGIDAYLKGLLPYTLTGYVFKADIAMSIDFGDFSEIGYVADISFIWRAASRYNFVVTNFKGGNYTAHAGTASSTLVNCFDERFLYWWRNRMLLIMEDPKVSDAVKNKMSKYYLTHSTKSFYSFKYYLIAAILLMIDRAKKGQYKELGFDFIAMRSFLSWSILIGIKFAVIILVYLKLDDRLRSLIRLIRRVHQ